eukprot:5881321-Pyramimonas_sp.AAC.1
MVGASAAPALKTKAMETYGAFLYLVDKVDQFQHEIGSQGAVVLESGKLLREFTLLIQHYAPN